MIALNNIPINILISLLFGVSIGIGLPSMSHILCRCNKCRESRNIWGYCLGHYWLRHPRTCLADKRTQSSPNVRSAGFVEISRVCRILLAIENSGENSTRICVPSYRSLLGRRDMLLYLLPWIMFSLVNFTEAPIINNLLEPVI